MQCDITLRNKPKLGHCFSIVGVTPDNNEEYSEFANKAGLILCPNNTMVFEHSWINGTSFKGEGHWMTPNTPHHIHFKQFRQEHFNDRVKRLVKIDGKIVVERVIEKVDSFSGTLRVRDIKPIGSISNLRITK